MIPKLDGSFAEGNVKIENADGQLITLLITGKSIGARVKNSY